MTAQSHTQSYHQTVLPLTADQEQQYEAAALRQDERILKIMMESPTFTGWNAELFAGIPAFSQTPLTSIRRALSNLKTRGKIVCSGVTVGALYGRPIKTWKVVL